MGRSKERDEEIGADRTNAVEGTKMIKPFRGHYVGGDFQIGNGASFLSTNPARDYEVVFEARDGLEIVDAAVDAARQAQRLGGG